MNREDEYEEIAVDNDLRIAVQRMLTEMIRGYKRNGMTRTTFYKSMDRWMANNVRTGTMTSEDAIAQLNEYMRIFDEEERK